MAKFFKIIFFTTSFLVWLSPFLYTQTPDLIFQNLSSADGLPSNRIQAIFQDHLGFLWFGTDNGLVRYDGYQFKTYQPDDNDPYSISSASVRQITEDHNGNLWILTWNDSTIDKFNRETGKFTHFSHIPGDSTSLSYRGIYQFYMDSSGDLWVVTYNLTDSSTYDYGGKDEYDIMLDKINTTTGTITHYYQNQNENTSLSNYRVFVGWSGHIRYSALYEDSKGIMWIGTEGSGLVRYDRKTDTFYDYKHDPSNPFSINCDTVSCIYEDSRGNMWIGTKGGGLNSYSREKDTFSHYRHNANNPQSIGNDYCYKIFEDKSNNLWLALGNGLDCFDQKSEVFTHIYRHDPKDPNSKNRGHRFLPLYEDKTGHVWILVQGWYYNQIDRYDPQTGRFFHYQEDFNNPKTIYGHDFFSFLEDHSGTFWIGTDARGISKFDPLIQSFRTYKHEPGNINSLSHNRVDAIVESKILPGVIWIGTPDGLDKYEHRMDNFTHFRHDPVYSNSLNHNNITSILEDESGKLWTGSTPGGLHGYNIQDGNLNLDDHGVEFKKNWAIFSLHQDRSGIIWLTGTPPGLIRFDRKNLTFTRYNPIRQDPYSYWNSVTHIYEDKKGSLWIGTTEGLKKFYRQRQTFTPNLLQGRITKIYEDTNNKFWLGISGMGLALFDRGIGDAKFYNQDHGLPNNDIASIIEDDHGNLWLATAGGLSRFNPQTEIFTNFYTRHGLPSHNFQQGTGIKTSDGCIWLGTFDNGIVVFNPEDIEINTIIPKIVLTDIKLFNESLPIGSDSPLKQNISVAKEIHFAHWQNDISFECAALHFSQSQHNQYAFWLENYDKDWRYTGVNRVAAYTNLDPGEYVFHAKGANSYNVWNEKGISLRIVIHPPWWRTSLAYIIYVILFIAVLYGARRFEMNRVKLRNELKMKAFEAQKLQEVDKLKSRFFANISHEFRTPLTLIIGPLGKLLTETRKENLKAQYKMILRNAQQLLRLIGQLLDLSKLEAGGMSLMAKNLDIVPLLKGIVMAFMSLAERKQISLKFHAEQDSILAYVDQDKIEKIMSNLLSNAFKFTPEGGDISVTVTAVEADSNEKRQSPAGYWIEITVIDSGPGIPHEHLGKIFDRFFQIDDSFIREQQGSGIGLALIKELVELHHGKISVNSKPGEGTTFVVRLPLGKEHLRENEIISEELYGEEYHRSFPSIASEILETERQLDETGSTKDNGVIEEDATIVLVVEDNRDVRTYIHEHLAPTYHVLEAGDGIEGIKKAQEVIPDLIISDIMMPKMDGYKLCQVLKNDEKTSHIPVILLTAKASSESKIQGLETGADDYLIKPFDSKELLARVKNLIALRKNLRERFSREVVLKPGDIAITPVDESFLMKMKSVTEQHLGEEEFSIETLRHEVGMSRTQLHRKLRALIDQSPSQFVRSMRLQRAVELLTQKAGTVAEIAYTVGFGSQAYFTKCFHEQFGCSPKDYQKRNQ